MTTKDLYQHQAFPPENGVKKAVERILHIPEVANLALMPDLHLSGKFCVGAVAATKGIIIPDLIGGDIGCGILAVELGQDLNGKMIQDASEEIFSQLRQRIGALWGKGRNTVPCVADPAVQGPRLPKWLNLATKQYCTLGRGNHFLEIQKDEEESLWIMVHSGSRGVGQAIHQYYVKTMSKNAGKTPRLEASSPLGQAYQEDHDWAVQYAKWNRAQLVEEVVDALKCVLGYFSMPEKRLESVHNFLSVECIDGDEYFVHRKGANSAKKGEVGIIAGSMGTESFHVVGRGNKASLFSSSHGAGRRFSRGKVKSDGEYGALMQSLSRVVIDPTRLSRYLEDAPFAYKDMGKVMRAQKSLVKRIRALTPILNFKC